MSKERPYEFVPTIGLIIMIENYTKLAKDNIKMQQDLKKMVNELNSRFKTQEDDKQISIEEYMRGRDK